MYHSPRWDWSSTCFLFLLINLQIFKSQKYGAECVSKLSYFCLGIIRCIGKIQCTMCHLFDRSARAVIFIYSSDWKTQLGRRCWDLLASCKISLNPVQQFQRRSKKCLSQSWAMAAIFFFDRPEKHRLGRGHWDLASCQVSSNSVEQFQRRSRKCLSQSEAGAVILFFQSAQKHRLGRRCGHHIFPIGLKNTNLVEDIEIIFPVKFCWIPFSGFREEVENVSANQRLGRPSCFFRSARNSQTW